MVRAPHVHNNLKEAVSLKHQKKYAEALDILSKLVRDGGSNDRVKSIYIDTLLSDRLTAFFRVRRLTS